MLFLFIQLGNDRFALDALQVTEILPLVSIKPFPNMSAGVAGVFTYRGRIVPAIDLSEVILRRPARQLLSTRIVLARAKEVSGGVDLLGFITEQTTETARREPGEFVQPGIVNADMPYLGPVANEAQGLVQWIDIDKLAASVRPLLGNSPAASP